MPWDHLATQFCLQLTFGVLLALAFVPRAPVGAFFYRMMGTAALVPALVAAGMPWIAGEETTLEDPWRSPERIAAWVVVVAWLAYAGPARGARWWVGVALGLLGCSVGLVAVQMHSPVVDGPLEVLATSTSALATGAVAGSVGLAMVLGHWYLTVPKLEVRHLERLNRVCLVSMVASLLAIVLCLVLFRAAFDENSTPLLGPWGMFHLGTRLVVGLLLPMLFAWMTADSLRHKNTRSATGILYASTVLVMIGTAVSVSLLDSYGVSL